MYRVNITVDPRPCTYTYYVIHRAYTYRVVAIGPAQASIAATPATTLSTQQEARIVKHH